MKRESEVCETMTPPLVDQLKTKRAKMAKEHAARMRRLDRHIELLEGSDAENILREAEAALLND